MSEADVVYDEPETKDFAYYAELAEDWLAEAERLTPQIYNPRAFDHAMKSADVYARLAVASAAAAAAFRDLSESLESKGAEHA